MDAGSNRQTQLNLLQLGRLTWVQNVLLQSEHSVPSWDNPSLFQLSHTPSALPKFIDTKPCWVFVFISPSLTQILTVTSSFSRAKSWWSTWTDQSSLSAPSISFSVPEERKKKKYQKTALKTIKGRKMFVNARPYSFKTQGCWDLAANNRHGLGC